MYTKIKDLKIENNKCLYYNNLKIKRLKKQISSFLLNKEDLQSNDYAKKILFPQELLNRNRTSSDVAEVVKRQITNLDENYKNRIINIIRGYTYIESTDIITKDTLNELYKILSCNLLDEYERENMGEYYRKKDVYILNSNHPGGDYNKGIAPDKIDVLMELFFHYLNKEEKMASVDEFIKSQILHFYFIYVHPYYDINGRTSRAVATWYLLKKKAYPYVIFNRAIAISKEDYKRSIQKSRKKGNLTHFLEYILSSTLKELEKEYIIRNIDSTQKLEYIDKKLLMFYLSLDDIPTVDNLAYFYNGYDSRKSNKRVIDELIAPMIEKRIFKMANHHTGKEVLIINENLVKDSKILKYQKK